MKKRILGVIAFAAIAIAAGWNYQQSKSEMEMSDLAMENVEALASGEDSSCCIGSRFQVTAIPGGWHCQNDQGSSCCPVC